MMPAKKHKLENILVEYIVIDLVWLSLTFSYYSGFGTKLSPFFGSAKSYQIQNHIFVTPIAQTRCSSCYLMFFLYFDELINLLFSFLMFTIIFSSIDCDSKKSL